VRLGLRRRFAGTLRHPVSRQTLYYMAGLSKLPEASVKKNTAAGQCADTPATGAVECHERLGGLLRSYSRAAA
jgi:hypothetical protein